MATASSSRGPASSEDPAAASFFRPRLWATANLPEPCSSLPAHFQDLMEVAAELEARTAKRGSTTPSKRRAKPKAPASPQSCFTPRKPRRWAPQQSCTCRRRHFRKASCAETLRHMNIRLWRQKVMEGEISSEIRSFLTRNRQVTSLPELRDALNQSPEARRREVTSLPELRDALNQSPEARRRETSEVLDTAAPTPGEVQGDQVAATQVDEDTAVEDSAVAAPMTPPSAPAESEPEEALALDEEMPPAAEEPEEAPDAVDTAMQSTEPPAWELEEEEAHLPPALHEASLIGELDVPGIQVPAA
ncbi:unnamed protein product [Symbiodinium natans]|uniref:Uncharacterized protein n=1 Tax=Symbiodinium natans TaxID=878477 RepID=A0A812MJK4_9DINO|nr:unnamed protein product [Symbiodinium natans]